MRIAVIGAAVVLLTTWSASAAPPANDDCANPIVVNSLPFSVDIDTTEATQAATDPSICGAGGGPTVWFTVGPDIGGDVCVRTCGGTNYDTILAAHIGTCDQLGTYTCND